MDLYVFFRSLGDGMVVVMSRQSVPAHFVSAWETQWQVTVLDQVDSGLSPEAMVANVMENLVAARQLSGTYGHE